MSFNSQFAEALRAKINGLEASTFKTNQEGAWHGADIQSQIGLRGAQGSDLTSQAAHRDAMSPLLQKSQGLANDMSGMRNTYGRAALPIEIQAKQGMAGLGPGIAQLGFGSRPSAMPQSVSIPDITAPSSPMPQTQPLGLPPLELQAANSSFEKQQQPYGMRRGRTYVRDKKGRGNPKKDTVNAKLAEGEAVLNAHAAESLGRATIAALNARGAEAMGLRGSARMKGGKLHAAEG